MKRIVLGAVALAAPILLSATSASAATISAVSPHSITCNGSISNSGHTASEKCSGTLTGKSQFRIVVNFCNTGNCAVYYGPWVAFGKTSSVTSGGYATLDNIATQFR